MTGSSNLAFGKGAAIAAFVIGLLVILGAWGSQLWGGLVPCELCLGERMPYYWGLPILAVILLLWNRLPRTVWTIAMLIVAAIFVWSIYLGLNLLTPALNTSSGPDPSASHLARRRARSEPAQQPQRGEIRALRRRAVARPYPEAQPCRLQRAAVAGHRGGAAGGGGRQFTAK